MNFFSLENLLVTIFCLTLAYFIAKYAENKAQRIWVYFNCVIAIWSFGFFLDGLAKLPQQAIYSWKTGFLGVTFISVLFYHFVCAYYKLKRKNILITLYIQAFIFSYLILFTNLIVKNPRLLFDSIYYLKINSWMNAWWIIWCIIVIVAFCEFGINLKNDKSYKTPSLIMFWAMLIGFLGGSSTMLPTYGIMIYPKYQISVCLYTLLIAYGIFYHRLLPINIVIKRSVIYSLLAATISLTYLLGVLISQKLFHQYFGYSSTIIGSIIIAIAFIPLKNKIQNLVDKFIFKATPLEIAYQNEKLKAIAALASGMAHEIKNPLTPIKTFSEQLPSHLEDKEFLLKFSKIIGNEVERIDSLVQQLLSFAKPQPPQLQSINIHQLIDDTLGLLNNDLIRHHITIHTSYKNKDLLINADSRQIKEAFLNIFLNAIDAMPHGGKLTVESDLHGNNHLEIKISDTGCGIDPGDLPHIFDPFFTKKDHGTGLGLSVTYEAIKNHKGKISVESQLGQGTTLKIQLPL